MPSRPRSVLLAAIARCALLGALSASSLSACDVFDESMLASPARAGDAGDLGREPPAAANDGAAPDGNTSPSDGGGAAPDATSPGGGSGSDAAVSPPDPAAPPQACEVASITSYCQQLPALPAAPVIDGELDCGAPLLPLEKMGWNGASAAPAQHETKIAAAARPDGLYVYVEVRAGEAPRPHPAGSYIDCGDAVEIYVDADGVLDEAGRYSSPGTMQFIVAAPSQRSPAIIEALRFVGGENQGSWRSELVETVLLPDGYAVEAFITAADLELTAWSPQGRIGFDIAIDVSAAPGTPALRCGLQLGQYFLRRGEQPAADAGICNGKPWCDTRAFCTPELP